MQVGDIVKLIQTPSVDWMKEYLDKKFEVQDFLTGSLKVKMLDTDPEWVWYVSTDNFELAEGGE
jgi:uncharacterized protein YaiE (UPF0345 family)